MKLLGFLISHSNLCFAQETTTSTTTVYPTTWTTSIPTTTSAAMLNSGCGAPRGIGVCVDLSHHCNFKVESYSNNREAGSKATVRCRQHHRLNIPYESDPYVYGQSSTFAYCRCAGGFCEWIFNKGDVVCSYCPAEKIQARAGKKLQVIEWETGLALYFPIVVDKTAENWSIALDFGPKDEKVLRRDADAHPDLSDDIIYTPCQAERLREDGHYIPETHVEKVENDQWCQVGPIRGRALASVNMWNQPENYNPELGMWEIPYFFDRNQYWNPAIRTQIKDKLAEFDEKTCVRMVEVDAENKHADRSFESVIKITNAGPFCASHVGRVSTEQKLYLGNSCHQSIIPQHEFMHALGYWHEQQRPDRDQHIRLHRDRCYLSDTAYSVNFGSIGEKWNKNLDNEYDIKSIMHYGPRSCAKFNGGAVFTRPDGQDFEWQTPVGLSKLDIEGINKAYPCEKVPQKDRRKTVVHGGNLKLTAVSTDNRIWSFAPNTEKLRPKNWEEDKKLYFLLYFDNLTQSQISRAKKSTLIFFKHKMADTGGSCLVDRFTDYPL